eukprot:TRINITY_DN54799_c0_g1_i1.p2 TRINITY_DN54799_c0_g1~~TRINITY_DN54799_c0_g1_i1.p2  ORF type:complete len:265 (-),score=28.57 TRINITY_DN54799_c0_g1_i1:1269-2063(-)
MLHRCASFLAKQPLTIGAELRGLVAGYNTNVQTAKDSLTKIRPLLIDTARAGNDQMYQRVGGDVLTSDVINREHLSENLTMYKSLFSAEGLDLKLQTDSNENDFLQISWRGDGKDSLDSFVTKDEAIPQCFESNLVEIEEINCDASNDNVQLLVNGVVALELTMTPAQISWLEALHENQNKPDWHTSHKFPTTQEALCALLEKSSLRVIRAVLVNNQDGTAIAKVVLKSRLNQAFVVDFRPSDACGLALAHGAEMFLHPSLSAY